MQINPKKYPPLVYANTITPEEIHWLWWPYIPAGNVTMIFGPGGAGKSHITVDMAARVSTGRAFPGQATALPAQKVLMMAAEDDFPTVLVPRLIQAGADLEKIAFPKAAFTIDLAGLQMVEQYMEEVSAGIVFIDPLVVYVGGKVDINRSNETRVFVGGLQEIAKRSKAPIIVVHHARKGSEGSDRDRMMGSADFNNAVRSSLFVTQAPNGDRIMKHAKSNYAKEGPTLRYTFGDEGFLWDGVYTETGILAGEEKTNNKRSKAKDWIRETLAAGPLRSISFLNEATAAGFNIRTLNRAKEGVAESISKFENGHVQWYWQLLEDQDGTDRPIMDDRWGDKQQSRRRRENDTREAGRTRGVSVQVVEPRSQSTGGVSAADAALEAWVKENI